MYTNLNRKEINERVKQLKKEYAEKNMILLLNANVIFEYHQLDVWYNGNIAEILYKNRYIINFYVSGTIGGLLYNDNKRNNLLKTVNRCNGNLFYYEMNKEFATDEDYCYALNNGNLVLTSDYNHIKMNIYDNQEEYYVVTGVSMNEVESVLDIGYDKIKKYLKLINNESYTEDETRELFLDRARDIVDYWSNEKGNKKECVSGAIFSILSMLDGCSSDLPGFRVSPICNESDKKYYIDKGEKFFDKNIDIAGCLHEQFYKNKK